MTTREIGLLLICAFEERHSPKMTPKSHTFGEGSILLSPTLTESPLILVLHCGYQNIMNSVFESLSFNLFLIIHTPMAEIQLFNLANGPDGSLFLKKNVDLCVFNVHMIANVMIP